MLQLQSSLQCTNRSRSPIPDATAVTTGVERAVTQRYENAIADEVATFLRS